MATDTSNDLSVPFPSTDNDEVPNNMVSSESSNSNQETNSSKLTSSDKLSALPPSTSMSPNLNRIRSPGFGQNRAFRRSLDASVSLPSDLESAGGFGSPPHTWSSRMHASAMRSTASDGSYGHETPKRVSFDSDRISLPTIQSIKQAFSGRPRGGSDSVAPSPALRSSAAMEQKDALGTPSPSRSRATSPLRLLQQWSTGFRNHNHEDPFVPVDPFRLKLHLPRLPCFSPRPKHDIEISINLQQHDPQCAPSFSTGFMTDTLPRIIYLHFLLRLPALYFSRVARIFEDAEVSKPDIQRMIDASTRNGGYFFDFNLEETPTVGAAMRSSANVAAAAPLPFPDSWSPPLVSPALVRFKHSWEAFIDSLMREWKTLNVVSALLLSAILTMFQIPSAATDPLTRTTALLSLICALMSLSYGCMYIVRFGTMRSMYRASRWAEEARKTDTFIWWNVWVLLAMPAVWMAWSMVFFIFSILSFVWRTGSVLDPDEREPLSARAALGPRIAITLLFCIGMVYFVMIVKALKSYGPHGMPNKMIPRRQVQPVHLTPGGEESRGRPRERIPSRSLRRRDESPERGRSEPTSRSREVVGLGLVGVPVFEKESGEANEKIEVIVTSRSSGST